MCLLLLANECRLKYKLIIAANRDEFYKRPTESAHFWAENKFLLAGKDLEGNGTWLGITKNGKFAALTNYRDMSKIKANAPTRGMLVINFLLENTEPKNYSKFLINKAGEFNGYNLIFGNVQKLFYFSNISKDFIEVKKGVHGLSNHLLDTPWPKVVKAKEEFEMLLKKEKINEEQIFNLLYDNTTFEENLLPQTGLSIEMEKLVSPIFTITKNYGTRSSTVILIDYNGNVSFTEKSFNNKKENFNTSHFDFKIEE
jgi:uncharacterized protein with NRDE domain